MPFYLPSSDVTDEEEQSRQAFLARERGRVADQEVDIVESDDENDVGSPDDWLNVLSLDSKAAKEMILKHRELHRRKSRVRAAKAIQCRASPSWLQAIK